MTPEFSEAVDPVFLHVLGLLEKIGRGESPDPQDQKVRIRALLDQAHAKLGQSQDWEYARYALVVWIDEVLIEAPWEHRDWWNNNVLEVDLYGTREAFEKFFIQAREASGLPKRDALEVFYVCVVLGFRGLYREEHSYPERWQLPADLESWARQTSMAIQLGRGRRKLPEGGQPGSGAAPLGGPGALMWSTLIGVMLSALLLMVVILVFFDEKSR
jgi:type VI secretion system protein ImpK